MVLRTRVIRIVFNIRRNSKTLGAKRSKERKLVGISGAQTGSQTDGGEANANIYNLFVQISKPLRVKNAWADPFPNGI